MAGGRDFLLTVWDDHDIGHPDGSWSFMCGQARTEDDEQQAFVRVLLPLDRDLDTLLDFARAIADSAEFSSGHAGLSYVFDPDLAADALDAFYALAKRYWGIDVAELDAPLAVVAERIKGVDWLTLLGDDLLPPVADELGALAREADIGVERHTHGVLIRAGAEPHPGDQNRKASSPDAYRRVARAIAPLFPDEFPDLGGEKFIDTGDTLAWVRRFIDPAGW